MSFLSMLSPNKIKDCLVELKVSLYVFLYVLKNETVIIKQSKKKYISKNISYIYLLIIFYVILYVIIFE